MNKFLHCLITARGNFRSRDPMIVGSITGAEGEDKVILTFSVHKDQDEGLDLPLRGLLDEVRAILALPNSIFAVNDVTAIDCGDFSFNNRIVDLRSALYFAVLY